ncbi:MFS transporter [Oxyplasma meridianum]|uniref:MFS transporter n=1 Tax=Oxyplasma meridianum TaxID=3073602 RepID=A0AAX4NG08_9ARCH
MYSRSQNALILSTTSSFFLWGIIATIGPLSLSFPFLSGVSVPIRTLILSTGPVFVLLGNLSMGYFADRVGRKTVFITTMISYSIGVIAITFANTLPMLLVGLILSQFGVGGEEPSSLALVAEDFDAKKRASVLTLVANFSNIGSFFISGIFIVAASATTSLTGLFNIIFPSDFALSDDLFRFVLLLSSIVLVGIMVYSRIRIPESYRWLNYKGRKEQGLKVKQSLNLEGSENNIQHKSKFISMFFLVSMAISQYLTFGLMAYIIGPTEFSGSESSELIFYALLGASIAGFIAMPLVSRNRKSYTFYAYMGGFLSMVVIFALVNYLSNLLIFIPLLIVNMAFSEFAWASRTTLEPELLAIKHRSFGIGIIRMFPMILYIVSISLTANFSIYQFILYNLGLWSLGALGAAIWMFYGTETRNISLDY